MSERIADRLYSSTPKLPPDVQLHGERIYFKVPDGSGWNFVEGKAAEKWARDWAAKNRAPKSYLGKKP